MISKAWLILARRSIFFVFVISACCSAFAQESLPDGWRKPSRAETAEAWRAKSATRFLVVRGDFDGDGQEDLALLLVHDAGKRVAVFARLSGQPNAWQMIHEAGASVRGLGIKIARPRNVETLCSADPSACAPETPKTLQLVHPAIEFFVWGEASSIFYWDAAAKEFRNIPLSD
jgi:hypothetical protein